MRVTTRLKYGLLRLLGVVSPSGRYPLPPRWAMSKLGRHRFYDAPECDDPTCEAGCCGPLVVSAGALPVTRCLLSCCAPASDTVGPVAAVAVNGRERGDSAC